MRLPRHVKLARRARGHAAGTCSTLVKQIMLHRLMEFFLMTIIMTKEKIEKFL